MFQPTHRHADGGFYRYIAPCPGKDPGTEAWIPGIIYQGDDLDYRWTAEDRWDERFTKIDELGGIVERSLVVEDETAAEGDQVVAYYKIRIADAGDVRHLLMTAGPMPGSRQAISNQFVDWMKYVLTSQAEMIGLGLHLRDREFPDLMGDVAAFHAKFGQEYLGKPRRLPEDLFDFRVKFHNEETTEYADEQPKLLNAIERSDRRDILHHLELQLDALCDAVWVVLGSADLQFGRRIFFEAWKRVVKANMAKVRKLDTTEGDGSLDSGREPKYDIVKPKGWEAPDHKDLLLDNAIFDEIFSDAPAPQLEDHSRYSDTRAV